MLRSMTGSSQNKPFKNACADILIVLAFILSFSCTAFSQENNSDIPLNIKAENLKFNQASGIVNATGSVEVRFEDFIINSDKLIVDTNAGMATAEGKVLMQRQGYKASSLNISYDFENDMALIKGFSAVISAEGVKGPVFLNIEGLADDGEIKTGSLGNSTTCDLEHPHYNMLAKSFYFKPGDKVVAYSATTYVNGVPVMWLPVFIYDLANRRTSLLMPIIGSNDVEGNFVKTELQYFVNAGAWGSIYTDFMSKKGIGYGAQHNYKLNSKNSGSAYLYHVYESDTGIPDWIAKLNHEYSLDDRNKIKFGYDHRSIYLVPTGRLDQTGVNAQTSFGDDKRGLSVSFDNFNNRISNLNDLNLKSSANYDGAKTDYLYSLRSSSVSTKWQNISQGLYDDRKFFSDKLSVSTRVNFYRALTMEGAVYDDRLEPSVNLSYSGAGYDARLNTSYFIDTDGSKYDADNNAEYVEKMPELILSAKPVDIATISIKPEISYGKFHESKYLPLTGTQRHFTTGRYRYSMIANKTFSVVPGTNLSAMGGVDQFNYDTGDQRYAEKGSLTLQTDAGGWYSNSLRYELGTAEGNSPFFFDSSGSLYRTLRDTMVFYKGTEHRFTLDGGYNYMTNTYMDLLYSYSFRPNGSLNLNVNSGYDIENKKWRDLVAVAGLSLLPALKDDVSYTYSLDLGKTTYATNYLDLEIGDSWQSRWHFKIGHIYDVSRDAIIMQEATIVKDLHCWEMSYSWSELRKEFRVIFTLKAFPEMPVGYASGSRGFYIEGMTKDSENRY